MVPFNLSSNYIWMLQRMHCIHCVYCILYIIIVRGVNGGPHSHWMLVWVKIHTGPKHSLQWRRPQVLLQPPRGASYVGEDDFGCLAQYNQVALGWGEGGGGSSALVRYPPRRGKLWCKTYDPSISLPPSQLARPWQMNFGCKGWGQFARTVLHLKTP